MSGSRLEPPSGSIGLLLAAGAGSRMGGPKAALVDTSGQSLLARALAGLRAGGCVQTYAVIGSAAEQVRHLVPADTHIVVAAHWAEGMGASLRAGLGVVAAVEESAAALVVTLVDTPDVGPAVVRRLLDPDPTPAVLARCTYRGKPGHPVLIGRDHWAGVAAAATGDRGARDYLAGQEVRLVECADIADGTDVDTPAAWATWLAAQA